MRRAAALPLLLWMTACAGGKAPPAPPAPPPTAAPLVATPVAPLPTPVPVRPLPPPTAFILGTVTYAQRVALTPQAEVSVELRDVTAGDAPGTLVARQVISTPGQVPISFSLEYDPTRIFPGRTYAVSARIVDRGQLQFVTDARVPVLTGGSPEPVEIVVVPIR